jgi:hypothetical protein
MSGTAVVAWLALVVSGVSGYLSLQKLRLDLFGRRYDIFHATWSALSQVLQTPEVLYLPTDLNNVLPAARFLFPKKLYAYVNEVSKKISTLYVISMATRSNNNVVPAERVQERGDLMRWFATEAIDGCKDKFKPYLDFSRW